MKKLSARILSVIVAVILCVSLLMLTACGEGSSENDNIQCFYDTVVKSQECLDAVADDIYSCWYAAIYKKQYGGNIDVAITYAMLNNTEKLNIIEANDETIKSLFKTVKDSDFATEIKTVMSAYSDYYELVVNVSGSFNSYSAEKETLKKKLASALKKLQLEM